MTDEFDTKITDLDGNTVQVDEQGRLILSPITETQVAKLNLQPGDVLTVTVKSDDIDADSLLMLRKTFMGIFPNNKIAVFGLNPDDSLEFKVIGAEETEEPKGYCNDCNCGKKEAAEKE